MSALSRAIDGLQRSVFELAKRQPAVDAGIRARNSSAGPTRVSRGGVSAQGSGDQLVQIALRVLKEMPARDREVLSRFYVYQEQPEGIQRALGITETQFRRVKWRAKSRSEELRELSNA